MCAHLRGVPSPPFVRHRAEAENIIAEQPCELGRLLKRREANGPLQCETCWIESLRSVTGPCCWTRRLPCRKLAASNSKRAPQSRQTVYERAALSRNGRVSLRCEQRNTRLNRLSIIRDHLYGKWVHKARILRVEASARCGRPGRSGRFDKDGDCAARVEAGQRSRWRRAWSRRRCRSSRRPMNHSTGPKPSTVFTKIANYQQHSPTIAT